MKRASLTVLIILLIVPLNSYSEKINEYKLEERSGIMFVPNQSKPFTGKSVDYYLYFTNQPKMAESNYKEGILDGLSSEWYDNGHKKYEGMYKDGIRVGAHVLWYESGQKGGVINFKNGMKDGKWIKWHENGQKWTEAIYKDDKLVGKEVEWDEAGKKRSVAEN